MRPCPFARAILAGYAECHRVARHHVAERLVLACTEAQAQARCDAIHDNLCRGARFAWRMRATEPWSFGQELRVQCGALVALATDGGSASPAIDLDRSFSAWPTDARGSPLLPYDRMIRGIVAFRPRRRSRPPT